MHVDERAVAEEFIRALNAFDASGVEALLALDFDFTVGPHAMSRDEFLAGVRSGPAADPYFAFDVREIHVGEDKALTGNNNDLTFAIRL